MCPLLLFIFSQYLHHRYLHSFPTRRSSDLKNTAHALLRGGARQALDRIDGNGEDKGHEKHEAVDAIERAARSEEHTSELQSPCNLVCRLLLEKKKLKIQNRTSDITYQHRIH